MIPELRRAYNVAFTEEAYARMRRWLEAEGGCPVDFRISETPLFLPLELAQELERAAWEICGQVQSPEYLVIADRAILADQSLKYVLVVNKAKDNVVERVDIEPADRVQEDGLRVVNAGLKGDEWLIVEGVNRARPGVNVAPKEGPMPRRPVSRH